MGGLAAARRFMTEAQATQLIELVTVIADFLYVLCVVMGINTGALLWRLALLALRAKYVLQ